MPKPSNTSHAGNSSPRSVVHATFCIERTYPASRGQVFNALTDPAAKAKWFTGGDGYTLLVREMDVRPGGREHVKGRKSSGVVTTFDALYFDVVPDERLVYAYEMHIDDVRISVSLATLELVPEGAGASCDRIAGANLAFKRVGWMCPGSTGPRRFACRCPLGTRVPPEGMPANRKFFRDTGRR